MPLVSTSWARRGSLLAEEPTLEPHKHIRRCVSMRSDRPSEPRPPRWMKTEKSGGETENNHQANYHTITAGSCPHPSLSLSDRGLEWEHVWQGREENRRDLPADSSSRLSITARFHFNPEATAQTIQGCSDQKQRREEEKKKSRETHKDGEWEMEGFFSWMKHAAACGGNSSIYVR